MSIGNGQTTTIARPTDNQITCVCGKIRLVHGFNAPTTHFVVQPDREMILQSPPQRDLRDQSIARPCVSVNPRFVNLHSSQTSLYTRADPFPFSCFFSRAISDLIHPLIFTDLVDRIGDRRAVNRLTSKLVGAKASIASSVVTGLNKPVPELTRPSDALWCLRFPLQTQSVGSKS